MPSEQELSEWRAHPVTEAMQAAMAEILRANQTLLMQRYWHGSPALEAERLALHRLSEWVETFFEIGADDLADELEAAKEVREDAKK